MRFGDVEAYALSDGFFKLDGGAMFGIVPKPLWERRIPSDNRNRIRLGLNPLLVIAGGKRIIVETGIGAKYDPKTIDIYDIRHEPPLLESLAANGFSPEDIDFVVLTHLHFDHCGGNTGIGGSGKPVPVFPNAKHVVQAGEWRTALAPDTRSRASYLAENLVPLEEAGLVMMIDGEAEIAEGVRCVPTPGHTAFHQSVLVESRGERLFMFGDLVPTASHLDPAWVMGYDVNPIVTVKRKEDLLPRMLREGWTVYFEHDPNITFAKVESDGRRYTAKPVSD